MKEPLFSIITVTRNNAKGVALTAKSIALQMAAPEYEWLVIDGASTDDTAEKIAPYLSANVTFISERDDGLYDAMNKGMRLARGRYVWFLNGGDCLADSYVLRDVMREIPAAVGAEFIYGDAREDGNVKKAGDFHGLSRGMITAHQAMLYRRDAVKNITYDTAYKIAADYAFTLQVAGAARNVHYFPRILCDCARPGLSHAFAETGRLENFNIRRDLLGMPDWRNRFIYRRDALAFYLRGRFPKLYWRLRFYGRR